MKLLNVHGKLVGKRVDPYLIKWDGASRSNFQFDVKQFLKPFWKSHIVYEEFPVYGTKLRVDIFNASLKVAVEVNGKQHESFNKFFHINKTGFWQSIKRDNDKFKWLDMNGIMLIEIEPADLPVLSAKYIFEKFGIKI